MLTSLFRPRQDQKEAFPPEAGAGAGDGIRTHNLPLTRRLLCQLSYPGATTAPILTETGTAVQSVRAAQRADRRADLYQRFSLSRFSKYRSSLRLTRCNALSTDFTWRSRLSAIS